MQTADRKRLREGVIRDLERQEKKRRNLEELEQQIELTKKLQEQRDKWSVISSWKELHRTLWEP